jgi:AraC-like DNA-binding protein
MSLTVINIIDLCLRCMAIGQLSFVAALMLSRRIELKSLLTMGVTVGISAYLLLTAPTRDLYHNVFRGVLLLLTDIFPYLLWCLAFAVFRDDFHPKNWPIWIKALIGVVLLWFVYFFVFKLGLGIFHTINHVMAICLLLHVFFEAIKGLRDDLVESRRKIRIVVVSYFGLYGVVLTLLEFSNTVVRGDPVFRLINGVIMLASITGFSILLFKSNQSKSIEFDTQETTIEDKSVQNVVPPIYQQPYNALCQLMDEGYFKQSDLTIKHLSEKMALPEHQLRELINQHLGFRNFSTFLNGYRIRAACAEFENIDNLRTPILTIALALGYGSIGPFNRSFKALMGQTPSEYRQIFHN